MSYCQDKIGQRRHPHSPGLIRRKHGIKARLKPRWGIIKSYHLCPALQSHSVVITARTILGKPTPKMLVGTPWLGDTSLGLVLLSEPLINREFSFPTSINSQGKQYVVLIVTLSGAACRNPESAVHCLVSQDFL